MTADRATGAEEIRDDEFDRVAGWTAEVIEAMDLDDPVPAACNGSGSPAALAWLAAGLELGPASRVVDTGAGIGGPAAWLSRRYGAGLVTAEPMFRAVRGSRRVFGLPGVVAWSHRLPFRPGAFDAAVALAVLSTVEDKGAYLAEVRRVLRPDGRLGLLDYVRTGPHLPDPPANNDFLLPPDLDRAVAGAGFHITATAMADRLPEAPERWDDVANRIGEAVGRAHAGDPALEEAERQQARFGRLLADGHLAIRLICASRR